MKITLETDSKDLSFRSKVWRTYKCFSCGCQDVRIADGFEGVQCPDCGKMMQPLLFVIEWVDGILLLYCSIYAKIREQQEALDISETEVFALE